MTVHTVPLIRPISLNDEGHDSMPIPTIALNVLANASRLVSLTMYFSDFLNILSLLCKLVLSLLAYLSIISSLLGDKA